MNVFSKLKKKLAMGTLAAVSVFYPMENRAQASEATQQLANIELNQGAIKPIKIVNETDAGFKDILVSKLNQLQQTNIGKKLLANCPSKMNLIIKEKPEGVDIAGYFDGQNCVIYDDTLLSMGGGIFYWLMKLDMQFKIPTINKIIKICPPNKLLSIIK